MVSSRRSWNQQLPAWEERTPPAHLYIRDRPSLRDARGTNAKWIPLEVSLSLLSFPSFRRESSRLTVLLSKYQFLQAPLARRRSENFLSCNGFSLAKLPRPRSRPVNALLPLVCFAPVAAED
ncbi:hypothetical protein EVAR_11253_1 [Eumeta japonica]|uniref:Uncharacterized protein n=1 Tax=Eumeta variegata TaxID=151549 RepID=A0A4C1UL16_EUMVA|nr:hypothetical protein EVAR_11253_1 [Eumeta japonica]